MQTGKELETGELRGKGQELGKWDLGWKWDLDLAFREKKDGSETKRYQAEEQRQYEKLDNATMNEAIWDSILD